MSCQVRGGRGGTVRGLAQGGGGGRQGERVDREGDREGTDEGQGERGGWIGRDRDGTGWEKRVDRMGEGGTEGEREREEEGQGGRQRDRRKDRERQRLDRHGYKYRRSKVRRRADRGWTGRNRKEPGEGTRKGTREGQRVDRGRGWHRRLHGAGLVSDNLNRSRSLGLCIYGLMDWCAGRSKGW